MDVISRVVYVFIPNGRFRAVKQKTDLFSARPSICLRGPLLISAASSSFGSLKPSRDGFYPRRGHLVQFSNAPKSDRITLEFHQYIFIKLTKESI